METAVSKCWRVKTKSTGFHGKQEPDVKQTGLQHLVCLGVTGWNMYVSLLASVSAWLWLLFPFACLWNCGKKLRGSNCCVSTEFLVEEGWLLALPLLFGNHIAGRLLCDMNSLFAYLSSRPVCASATFIEGSQCLPQWYSNFSVHRNHVESMLKQIFRLTSRASESLNLEWGPFVFFTGP